MATKYLLVNGRLLRDGHEVGRVEVLKEGRRVVGLEVIDGPLRLSVRRTRLASYTVYEDYIKVGELAGRRVEYQGTRVELDRREAHRFIAGSGNEVSVLAGGQEVGVIRRAPGGVEAELLDPSYRAPVLVLLAVLSMYAELLGVATASNSELSSVLTSLAILISIMIPLVVESSSKEPLYLAALASFAAVEAFAIVYELTKYEHRRRKARYAKLVQEKSKQ